MKNETLEELQTKIFKTQNEIKNHKDKPTLLIELKKSLRRLKKREQKLLTK